MAGDNEVKIRASIDDDYSGKAEKISDATKDVTKALEQVEKPAQGAGDALSKLSEESNSLSGDIDSVKLASLDAADAEMTLTNATGEVVDSTKEASKSQEELADKTKESKKETGLLDKAFKQLNPTMIASNLAAGLITKAVNMATNAIKDLGKFVVDSVYAFAESEMGLNRLEASLRNVHITSPYVIEDYKNFASQMQKTVGVSDDLILKQLTLATNFGLYGDKAKQATEAAYALSIGLDQDLNTAMMTVLKASEGNTAGLNKLGLKYEKTGDQAKDFENILGAINSRFGQLSGANMDNQITKTNVLKETWGDFSKAIGKAFEPLAKFFTNFLISSVEWLTDSFVFLTDNTNILSESFVKGFMYAELAVLKLKAGIYSTMVGFQEFGNKIGLVSDAALQGAKDILDSTIKDENAKKEQIRLYEEMTSVLDSQRDSINANTEANKKLGQEQVKAAEEAYKADKDRIAKEEELRKQAEQAEKDRIKRMNDFIVNAREERFKRISEIVALETAEEQAELIVRQQKAYDAQLTAIDTELSLLDGKNQAELEKIRELEEQKRVIREEFDAYNASIDALQEEQKIIASDADIARAKHVAELKAHYASATYQAQIQTLSNLATFQNAKTKELAAVGKAAAIAQAYMDTYRAANLAIATVPPPWGYALAASSTALGLANVAQISGVQLAVGTGYVPHDMDARIHEGEIVTPAPFSASLRSGELAMVNPSALAGSSGGGGDINVYLTVEGDVIGDTSENLITGIHDGMNEMIAQGRLTPIATGEAI